MIEQNSTPASSLSRYEVMVSYGAAGVQLLALAAIGIASALDKLPNHRLLLSFVAAPLYIIGITYALVGLKPISKRRPQLALLLLMAPLTITTLLLAYAEGGVSSGYYMFWLVLLMTSGISGYLAVDVSVSVSIGYYLLLAGISFASGKNFVGDWPEFTATVLAMAVSYVIAQQAEQVIKNVHVAQNLSGQLEGEQDKTELMMQAIADPVVGINQSRQVIVFNRAAEELTGWDKASALGIHYNTIFQLKDPRDQDVTDDGDPFSLVFAQNKRQSVDDYYVIDRNAEKVTFSIAIAPTYDGQSNINGAIAIFHDISEQKALQRERNEFVSTASHEMRTPVAAVEGYLSMATNPKLAAVDERARDYIEKAHQASLHLGKLFRDLLSVTRLEDKRLVDQRSVFDLVALVKSTVDGLQLVARDKGLVLDFNVESSSTNSKVIAPLVMVEADPDRLQEAISNLIDNAIKYTPTGKVRVQLETNSDNVLLHIVDTGMGIALEEQRHLFQKFYRVNNSMTREIGGTGLGLYLSRNLVERYGGAITVESAIGRGSTFTISLPIAKSQAIAGARE